MRDRSSRAGSGLRRFFCLLGLALAIPSLVVVTPALKAAAAAEPTPQRPEIATFAGQPVADEPLKVAQQPFAVASSGRFTYVADPVNHVVRLLLDQSEFAFAGNGGFSVEGDGGDPKQAQIAGAYSIAPGHVTSAGVRVTGLEVFIADTFGHKIRRVTVAIPPVDSQTGTPTATITTIAGTGAFGFSGDGGPAATAKLNSPYGVVWDQKTGNVYVADTLNNRIRAIAPDGNIYTVVGAGAATAALRASLNQPRGLAVDSSGRLWIADTGNNQIRLYTPGPLVDAAHGFGMAGATLTLFAGDGNPGYLDGVQATQARLHQPTGLALDGQGNLYVADTGNNVVRELPKGGGIRTVAGNGTAAYAGEDGPATQASLNAPFGVAVRDDGDILIADTGNNYLRLVDAVPDADGTHHIHRLAGNGTPSFAGDNHAPAEVQLAGPSAIAARIAALPNISPNAPQTAGTRYIADTFNHAVRWFTTAGVVQTLAGTGGVPGGQSTDGSRASHLSYPMGVAVDSGGSKLYVADTFNNQVRVVDLNSGAVSIFAGDRNGLSGSGGDGGPATSAQLSYPTGVAVDPSGNVYIADAYNARIRKVDSSGKISTVAGTGVLGYTGDGGDARRAELYFPYGVAVDPAQPGALYITDSFNHRVRRVDPSGTITTVAGDGTPDFSDGGPAISAHLNRPWSTAVDSGSLYVADSLNNRIRRVDRSSHQISTLAGIQTPGLQGDLGKADQAEVNGPRGVAALGDTGAVLVADAFNDRVRWIGVTQTGVYRTAVKFGTQNLATTSPNQSVTVTSQGNGLLVMGALDFSPGTSDFFLDPSRDQCTRQRLEPGVSCAFSVAFLPRSPGPREGALMIPDDAADAPQQVKLAGTATAPIAAFNVSSLALRQTLTGASEPQSAVLSNNGTGALLISDITIDSSDFVQSNDCPGSLLAGSSCTITVRLKQIASGSRSAFLSIADNATGSPQRLPLTGAVIAPAVALNPSGLGFTSNVGQTARSQLVQLTNTGEGSLTLSAIKVAGSPDFSQTNNCPTVVTPHSSCTLTINFTPSGTGQQQASVRLADDATDSPQEIALLGFGTMPSARVAPRSLSFSQNLSEPLQTKSITLTNIGDGPLTLSNLAVTGDYRQTNNCPGVIFAGQSCTVHVTFAPLTTGVRNGSLIVTDDADSIAGSQQVVSFSGMAFAPRVTLRPGALAPVANVGSAASPETVILQNSGDGALVINSVAITGPAFGDYGVVGNDCHGTILPGQACSVTVSFIPSAAGLRQAFLIFSDDARGSPQVVSLRGVGTGPLVSPTAANLAFGSVTVGTTSAPQSVVITNTGTGPLTISSITPPAGGEFAETNNCPHFLGQGGSCTITVTFTPSTPGARPTQAVVVNDNALNGTAQIITLNGTGS